MAVVFAMNWQGPFTLDNATKVAQRSYVQVKHHSQEICDWASPHLQPIREQWKHFSRFIAKNGREYVIIAWDKTVHYTHIAKEQILVTWPIVQQRAVEVINLTGDTAVHYWRIVCHEVPIYYESLVKKVSQMYQGTPTHTGNRP